MRSPAAFAEAAAALKRRRAELAAAAQPQQRTASSSSPGLQHQPAVSKKQPPVHAPQTPQSHLAQAGQLKSAAAPEAVPAAQSGVSSKARDSEAGKPQQAAGAEEMPTAATPGAGSRATDSAAASQVPQPGVRTRSSARAKAGSTAAELPCRAEAGAHSGVDVNDHLTQPMATHSLEKASPHLDVQSCNNAPGSLGLPATSCPILMFHTRHPAGLFCLLGSLVSRSMRDLASVAVHCKHGKQSAHGLLCRKALQAAVVKRM